MNKPPAAANCRHCGKPLDALLQRRAIGHCGAAACRQKHDAAHTARLRVALASTAPQAAAVQLSDERAVRAPVVWLQHCDTGLQPVTDADRAAQRAYLQRVITEAVVIDRNQLAGATATDGHAQGMRLCGQCGGRCCQHGAGWRAFIDLTLLQRWNAAHPDATLADAVDAYVGMLPAAHVHGSCLYQGAQGCAMPRALRADICNGFACDALQAVQHAAAVDPAAAVVVITFAKDQVERAALIDAAGARAFTLPLPVVPLAS